MLYVIPTPIGNLEDITLRALNLFKKIDIFICEDTRTFKNLLHAYDIDFKDKKFFSLTSYTNRWKIAQYLNLLKENDVWLVSEAGMPWLSDPGKELIKLCWEKWINFDVLPWANALLPWVIASCFPTNEFCFVWFLPQKKWRDKKLKEIINSDKSIFFYESVHRMEKLMNQLKDLWFDGYIFIWRELTKKFQQYECGRFEEIYEKFVNWEIVKKGEFVVGIRRITEDRFRR